uniref:CorA family divalent cation transporter n=1 Tax=Alistipes putredinis TaxID=28117 RepID=UPI003FD7D165
MITIYLKQYNKIIRNADTGLFEELGYDDILWIDMLQPTIKEQKAVENFMEINLQTKQQVEEIESTSKYSETENAIISNANFFVPTGESFVIEPVSFIISNEGVLVSVRSAEFRTFRETEKRLQMNYRNYSTGYHLFISLLEVRIDFDADLVELIAKQVAALSKDINSEDSIDKAVLHRISALQEELKKMGARIEVDGDTVTITGVALHAPAEPLYGHNDHRIVMALAVAVYAAGLPALLRGAEAVNKSWPAFWDTLRGLGAKIDTE